MTADKNAEDARNMPLDEDTLNSLKQTSTVITLTFEKVTCATDIHSHDNDIWEKNMPSAIN